MSIRRRLTWLHRQIGLATALFLALAGSTGAILAWEHELDGWLNPEVYFRSQTAIDQPQPDPLVVINAFERAHPQALVSYVELAKEPGHTLLVSVVPKVNPASGEPFALDYSQVALDPFSGDMQAKRMWGEFSLRRINLLPFLYRLHYSLHGPVLGTCNLGILFMGIVAVLWFIDSFIALVISFPNLGRWRASFAFRWRSGGSKVLYDSHRSSGVWLWALLTMFSLTSVSLNLRQELVLPIVSRIAKLTPHPLEERVLPSGEAQTATPLMTRENIVALAQAQAKNLQITLPAGAVYLDVAQQIYGVGFFEPGNSHADGKILNPWFYFDATSGELLGQTIPAARSVGDTFMDLQFPLHSGRLFGRSGRVAVSIFGVLVSGLSLTGILLWARRRASRRAKEVSSLHKDRLYPHSNESLAKEGV